LYHIHFHEKKRITGVIQWWRKGCRVAHIGVIEELERQGYVIKSVAGTSMGAMPGVNLRKSPFHHGYQKIISLKNELIDGKGEVQLIKNDIPGWRQYL